MNGIIGKDKFPDLSVFPSAFKAFKKPEPVSFKVSDSSQIIKTKEGPVKCSKGDFILTGVEGERWPMPPEKFKKTYTIKSDDTAIKNKKIVWCVKLKTPVKVKVSWSDDLLSGKEEDYLVQYDDDDYGIVGNSIFKKTYKKVK